MSSTSHNSTAHTLTTKMGPGSGETSLYTGWLVQLMMSGSAFPGFIGGEIKPPGHNSTQWTLIERFRTPEQLSAWRQSDIRRKLYEEVLPLISKQGMSLAEEESSRGKAANEVASAIVTHVKPGMEELYRNWECKAQSAQVHAPGYRGSTVIAPTSASETQWTTLVRFDSSQSLVNWFDSEARKKLLEEIKELVKSTEIKNVSNSFPGWFPVDDAGKGPPAWKTSLLVLLGLYPVVMLEIRYLNPLLKSMNLALSDFIGNAISVALTTWITVPLSIKIFKAWLFPTKETPAHYKYTQPLILLLLFVLEIAALWHLI